MQRLGLAIDDLPSAAEMADGTPSEAGALFADYAASMVELGFNMNFGPVVDVGSGSDLGTRSFGDDPSTVASFTDVIITAQEKAGIASVVKHWPGIGGGVTDPHVALADGEPIDELRAEDLVVFDRAIAARRLRGHGRPRGDPRADRRGRTRVAVRAPRSPTSSVAARASTGWS